MSFSFSIRAANKGEAADKVSAEFDKVVSCQSCHSADRDQAQSAVFAFINILPADDTKDVLVAVSGSLQGVWKGVELTSITGASMSVNAYLAERSQT